jgi:multicomponent Na+:H+ antiporter subunit B
MASPNVVAAILADYRGFDTMIEAAVVVTAVLACILILRQRHARPL